MYPLCQLLFCLETIILHTLYQHNSQFVHTSYTSCSLHCTRHSTLLDICTYKCTMRTTLLDINIHILLYTVLGTLHCQNYTHIMVLTALYCALYRQTQKKNGYCTRSTTLLNLYIYYCTLYQALYTHIIVNYNVYYTVRHINISLYTLVSILHC